LNKKKQAGDERGVLSRRQFVCLSGAAAATLAGVGACRPDATAEDVLTVPEQPTADRPDPQPDRRIFSDKEAILAFRNHGHLAEFLNQPLTPLGLHFLLIHFEVPQLTADDYAVALGGRVQNPRRISLEELKMRPTITQPVTMECAGTGRSTMEPRAIYVPWFKEAIGTYEWTGTPLAPVLEEAGLLDDAVEVLFTGWDSGVDLGVEHAFERSLPIEEALREEVMLAWAHNGQPLLPQHGYPLRLIVPRWYGMASVKWLRAITVLNEPFQGVEQKQVYRYQQDGDDLGEPVTVKRVHAVMKPPGIPDLISQYRFLAPGRHLLEGKAWSGHGPIVRVEVSFDGGRTWQEAQVGEALGPYAWTSWTAEWNVQTPGQYVLSCRATDAAGNVQPVDPNAVWNYQGMGGNGVERIPVIVQERAGTAADTVPSQPREAVQGADVPPPPRVENQAISPDR
jgi:sulfane dehydrogenase subunit SoxC